jgi:hypothetical protein
MGERRLAILNIDQLVGRFLQFAVKLKSTSPPYDDPSQLVDHHSMVMEFG